MRSFFKFCDCMHIKIYFFSQAKLQVGRINFHHNSNLDIYTFALQKYIALFLRSGSTCVRLIPSNNNFNSFSNQMSDHSL